ncbi:Ig-like domain-containing protein [Roseateles amylovorans]|uniref:Ig-like domain-containing protein n=1 Tax=Roseateles amylovorans TaxID=2978473 RepID=A0ABY6B397_9BURK|nr:Ig-like domain-containing protein [Roseateles amylovorans]UXH79542.1 Ig-like domain-containing protein [Roseateles amylovorans]
MGQLVLCDWDFSLPTLVRSTHDHTIAMSKSVISIDAATQPSETPRNLLGAPIRTVQSLAAVAPGVKAVPKRIKFPADRDDDLMPTHEAPETSVHESADDPAGTTRPGDPSAASPSLADDMAQGGDALPADAGSQADEDDDHLMPLFVIPTLGGLAAGMLSMVGDRPPHALPAPLPPQRPGPSESPGQPDAAEPPSRPPHPEDPGSAQPPGRPELPEGEQPAEPVDPLPPLQAPTLRLQQDTGRDDDRISSHATIEVLGLAPGARWDYSLDGGITWAVGEGAEIPAAVFATDGHWEVMVRQTDADGRHSAAGWLAFELDTFAEAPGLQLRNDTGASTHDFITRDGTLIIDGLETDARWEYSLDGETFLAGTGEILDAAWLPTHGAVDVQVRQIDVAGNISDVRWVRLHLHDHAEDLDLSELAGTQDRAWWLGDLGQLSAGIALTNTTAPLTGADMHRLTVDIGGDALDLANDRLLLDTELSLLTDTAADGVTIGGVLGLSYRYDAQQQRLTIWRTDDTEISGSEAAALTNSLRLRNQDVAPGIGDRTFQLSYEDMAGNLSTTATVTVTIDPRQPLLDLNGGAPGINADAVSADLASGVALFASDLTVGHQNPDATLQFVRITLTGGGASRDDRLFSRDGGIDTALDGSSSTFTIGGATWVMTRFSDTFTLSKADGSNASLTDTQAMLASLREVNPLASPLQGTRTFTVTLVDHLGRAATAAGSITYDTVAPQPDLNGRTPGVDYDVVVTPGLPWAFGLANPATGAITERNGVTQLTLRFSASVAGAFDTTTPDTGEWIGLFDPDRGDDRSMMLRLGDSGTLTTATLLPDRVLTLTLSDGPSPTLTITSDTALTQGEASELLRALHYTCEADAPLGLRTVEVTATDRAGNTAATGAVTRLDVRDIATPVLYLAAEADTGLHHNDALTACNGSDGAPLVLLGFAPAGQTVTVFVDANGNGLLDNGETLGSVVADANGQWRFTLTGQTLPDGDYRVGVIAGGLISGLLELTIDTRPPASTIVIGHTVHALPTLGGIADPDMPVTIEIDIDNDLTNGYEVRYEVQTDEAGHWRLDTGSAVSADGQTHVFAPGDLVNVRVTTQDLAGNETVRTATSTVDTTTYAITDSQVIEGEDGSREMVFLVTRTGDLRAAGSVRFAVDEAASSARALSDGAAADDDFIGAMAGLIDFAAGEDSKLIKFTIKGDYYREVNDTLVVRLDEPIGGVIQDGLGIGNLNEIDISQLQAAYGLRNLNQRQNDFAIRVRRSSDNAEQDIGFDASGNLDRQALMDFVGTGATDKGFVTCWYDQSGHGINMAQTDPAKQGVIVDGGQLVTRSDGSPAISFNSGRNGANNDYLEATGVAGTDWRSLAVYAKVQAEGTRSGTLFQLGDPSTSNRISAHYPEGSRYVFDVGAPNSVGRLVRNLTDDMQVVGQANDIVFEAHSGNPTAGTDEKNFTDGKQVIYENGVRVASDATLNDTFVSAGSWFLGWGNGSPYYQQVMFNEFLVYLATDNSTPSMRALLGTARNDVLTYAGERAIETIDGLAGHDTLYLCGDHGLDFSAFSGGVRGIEQVWMDNGAANLLTLSSQTVALNGADALTIRMDAGDVVVMDGQRFAYDTGAQAVVIGNAGDNIVRSTGANDVLIGGAGSDTFVWTEGHRGADLVWDYTTAQGDQLDLRQLLQGFLSGDEALYLRRAVDERGQVVLQVDVNGNADFAHPDLTITLAQVLQADAITVITAAGTSVL